MIAVPRVSATLLPLLRSARAFADDHLVAVLRLWRPCPRALGRVAPRVDRVRVSLRLSTSSSVRVVRPAREQQRVSVSFARIREASTHAFIATPRVSGRKPSQRMRPALPRLRCWWSTLLTVPIAAQHSSPTYRTSPLPRRTWACLPVGELAEMMRAELPADLARMAGPDGERVMAWMSVPTGISRSGRQFPGRIAIERSTPRSIWADVVR